MKKAIFVLFCSAILQNATAQDAKISHEDLTYFENPTSFELKNDLPDGTYLVYLDSQKRTLECKGSISNKKRTNDWIWYYETGIKKREIHYSNGVITGQLTSYYPNGTKSVLMSFNQGVMNGPLTRWYQNGIVKLEGSYQSGNPSGIWKYYKEDGSLLKQEQH